MMTKFRRRSSFSRKFKAALERVRRDEELAGLRQKDQAEDSSFRPRKGTQAAIAAFKRTILVQNSTITLQTTTPGAFPFTSLFQ